MASTNEIYESIKTRLDKAGIRKAIVADNLFDTPSVSELTDEISVFLNLLGRDEDLKSELREMGIGTSGQDEIDMEDIDDAAIAKLWNNRDDGRSISDFAKERLFPQVLRDYESLLEIVGGLESLGLIVTKVGSDPNEDLGQANLVLLDYYWGAVGDQSSPIRAGVVAREIYKRHSDIPNKPFFVLMSSRAEVESLAEKFRNDSDLLGGLFDFVLREELQDEHILRVKLATWAAGIATGQKIQTFVETLRETIPTKAQDFIKKVRSLTIEDYAYVQALRLQDDGQPLGDYMLWLFSSLLINFVLEDNQELANNRKVLDELSLESLLPSQKAPSNHLSEIYGLAIAEPTSGNIEPHPRDETPDEKKRLPLLNFGDLLIKDADSPLYMVATPDCDLLFSPGTKRTLDRDLSVILIPGKLYPLSDNKAHTPIQTELFHYKGEQYRIYWEPKKVISIAIKRFRKWCSDCGYSRLARIRLPYALKIQHEFTADLGRVGVPVSPPINEKVEVQFYSEGLSAQWGPLGDPVPAGVTIMHQGNERAVVVSTDCILQLLRRMHSAVEIYQAKRDAESNNVRAQRYNEKIQRIESCKENMEQMLSLVEKRWPLPTNGKTADLISKVLKLHNYWDSEGGCSDHLICVGIEYDNQKR